MKGSKIAAIAVGVAWAAVAWAMPNEEFQGKPQFASGDALGAWVWHDSEGHHVRFTTVENKVVRHFSGKVCGKDASAVQPVRTDRGDKIRVGPDGHCVVFDFTTNAGIDGFDFRMSDGGDIVYNLELEGQPMATKLIHIGKSGASPQKSPFYLNR